MQRQIAVTAYLKTRCLPLLCGGRILDISQASDWSRWPSRPIQNLRYIVTCTRIRVQYFAILPAAHTVATTINSSTTTLCVYSMTKVTGEIPTCMPIICFASRLLYSGLAPFSDKSCMRNFKYGTVIFVWSHVKPVLMEGSE